MSSKLPIKSNKGFALLLAALALCLLAAAAASLFVGAAGISLSALLHGKGTAANIVLHLRLPRVLGACLSGAAFAVSGAVLQTVLNNSLAAPNIIGVNAGSGLAMLLFTAAFPGLYNLFPAAAFLGGLACALIVYAIARLTGASRTTIILSGIAMNSVMSSVSALIKTLRPDVIAAYTDFTIGSLSGVTFPKLPGAAAIIVCCIVLAVFLSRDMNVLSLGDEIARSLGLRVNALRLALIIISAALSGAAVSFAGQISFVGLLVPHISRKLIGRSERRVIPFSALLGALLVLFCDSAARVIFAPFEMPVGIILSAAGGIFFIFLLLTGKGGKLHD